MPAVVKRQKLHSTYCLPAELCRVCFHILTVELMSSAVPKIAMLASRWRTYKLDGHRFFGGDLFAYTRISNCWGPTFIDFAKGAASNFLN